MKLVLVWVGRTRDFRWRALEEEYLSRLRKFVAVDVCPVRESRLRDPLQAQGQESQLLESRIPSASAVVALDERGDQASSQDFAALLGTLAARGTRTISFVMGGPHGLAEGLRVRADQRLALSRMTWPHEMARVMVLEQLYRAFSIMRGYPYHKSAGHGRT